MLLAEPPQTPWDLRFQLLGIRVRVSPFFWLTSLMLGWNIVRQVAGQGDQQFNVGIGFVIWVLGVFLSILVHEFGHAFAFRYFGIDADVVLYYFGGLAIPRDSLGFGRQMQLSSKEHIVVSAAGPAAQIALAVMVGAIFWVGGYVVFDPLPFIKLPFLQEGEWPSTALMILQLALVLSSIWWALINLLPVYPLDGGQIARDVLLLVNYQTGIRQSLILSVVTGGAMAIWAFTQQQAFLGMMFAILAFSSYQTLQYYSGRGGFGGGW
jgi:stage IV sporulation protein FB